MKKLCVWLLFALVSSSAAANAPLISTITLMPWDFARQPELEADLAKQGFTTVTLYIPWHDVEVEEGKFQFEAYDRLIDRLKKSGLSSILVLDFGGRTHFHHDGKQSGWSVLPKWYSQRYRDTQMRDFTGEIAGQPSYINPVARDLTSRFVDRAVRHFSQRHGKAVLGYALGFQEEHEIKFGQSGYRWRDYEESNKAAFHQRYGGPMPVINYNNEIGQALPSVEPLLAQHQAYREEQVKQITCHYARLIRQRGQAVVGYFGETFTSHDAIYATGAVEDLADCLDIAVIDFNYDNGYELVPNPWTLPMLANYLAHSGYRKILVGAYGERWVQAGKEAQLLPIIKQSIERSLTLPAVIGYEVGGFQTPTSATQSGIVDFNMLGRLKIDTSRPPPQKRPYRIGIFASKSNFYFWHGERSNGRNIHQDALTQSFALLSGVPDFEVVVIGERALRQDQALMRSLNALVVPHQAALPTQVKSQLKAYWKQGGTLVQDLRLGEFREDGRPTGDWLHDVFGIAGLHWGDTPAKFLYDGSWLEFTLAGKAYANHAVMVARPGYELGARLASPPSNSLYRRVHRKLLGEGPLVADAHYGTVLRGPNSLAFGLLPQLAEGPDAARWRQIYVNEIRSLAAKRAKAPSP